MKRKTKTSAVPDTIMGLVKMRAELAKHAILTNEDWLLHGVSLYRAAWTMKVNPDIWNDFCAHSDWEGERGRPVIRDRSTSLRHAIRFVSGFGNTKNKNRRQQFQRLLGDAWSDNVLPSVVKSRIRKLQETKSRAAAERRATKKAAKLAISFLPSKRTALVNACSIGDELVLYVRLGEKQARFTNAEILMVLGPLGKAVPAGQIRYLVSDEIRQRMPRRA